MNISLSGRKLELTDAIKAHMNTSIETLSKYHMDIISVNVVASAQTKKGKEHSEVEVCYKPCSQKLYNYQTKRR